MIMWLSCYYHNIIFLCSYNVNLMVISSNDCLMINWWSSHYHLKITKITSKKGLIIIRIMWWSCENNSIMIIWISSEYHLMIIWISPDDHLMTNYGLNNWHVSLKLRLMLSFYWRPVCQTGMVLILVRCQDGMVWSLVRCQDGMIWSLVRCQDGMIWSLVRC